MRFGIILASIAALWVQPAKAAQFFEFNFTALTTGTSTYYPLYPTCQSGGAAACMPSTSSTQANVSKSVLLPAFIGDQHYSFAAAGQRFTYDIDLHFDGSTLTGTNLNYYTFGAPGQAGGFAALQSKASVVTISDFRVGGDRPLAVTPESIAAVPEPTTWALMLLGFGMIGWVVRRRSQSKNQWIAARAIALKP